MIYEFAERLKNGLQHESELCKFLSQKWEVREAAIEEQRIGIDLHIKHRESGDKYSVEIKSDSTASKTGNAFIETISMDTQNKAGWAYTCKADLLLYYIPPNRLFYVLKPSWIKKKIKIWLEQYQICKIKNISYNTIGILVPLSEFEGKQKVSIPVTF